MIDFYGKGMTVCLPVKQYNETLIVIGTETEGLGHVQAQKLVYALALFIHAYFRRRARGECRL